MVSAAGARRGGPVTRTEVVVVGAGLLGLCAAYELGRRGRDVVCLEQQVIGHERAGSKSESRLFRLSHDDPFSVRLARRALPAVGSPLVSVKMLPPIRWRTSQSVVISARFGSRVSGAPPNATVSTADVALEAAEAVDAALRAGRDPGPLAGVPFGVKDLDDCAGMPTGRGSLWHRGAGAAPQDSIHVGRLRAAGAVPLGKTAVPEFGSLPYTDSRATGVTRNPWDLTRTPGGSSGGSAAAVASGMVPFATASDGGGSTRTPASFCGLVGYKASFGRIPDARGSRYSQTAAPGCLTTTVSDAALLLDVMAGPSLRDRTALPAPGVSYLAAIDSLDVRGMRAAWSPDLGFAGVDPEVGSITWSAAEALVDAAGLVLVDRPVKLSDINVVKLQLESQERWIGLAEGLWPHRAAELTPEVRSEYEKTEQVTLRDFARVLARRAEIEEGLAQLFCDVDVLLTPTVAMPAFPAEGPAPGSVRGVAGGLLAAVPFAPLANLWGTPAISLPAGLTASRLPVGLHIAGRHHDDATVLRLARLFELARPWPRHAPAQLV